jgi:MurNAc alpha-1-phosphate uridylyltransferase
VGSLLAGEWRDIGTVARLRALDDQLLAALINITRS